jgi:CDP-4-dehydro-6-deoxyglucose reductase
MGYRIQLLPSGHEFSAEPQETLLEAALRCGVNITYNCSTGSCGTCKARVVSGKTEDREFHDYHLSDNELSNGIILLCTYHALSNLTIEAEEASSSADIPHQHIEAKIAKIERLNDAIITLLVRTPRSQTLRFLAGQHVSLHIDGQAADLPISSCPCNGMLIQFHLRLGDDEPLASHLVERAHNGDPVQLDGPFGDFVLDDDSSRPMVMIAEDTGFASIKGLIEHAINLEKPQPLRLYRLALDPEGLYMRNYCESWREQLNDFAYSERLLTESEDMAQVLTRIAGEIPQLAQWDVYAALSQPHVEEARGIFVRLGVGEAHLHFQQQRNQGRESTQVPARGTV